MLKRQGVIETWHDRRITAGQDVHQTIDDHINSDEIILLLISADFLASDYCYEIEMRRAMERHQATEAIVIPIILRACDWRHAPFGKLNATPRDGKPVTQWPDLDEAFLQVAKAVREAAARIAGTKNRAPHQDMKPTAVSMPVVVRNSGPRSSNLRVKKTFNQREKDQFRLDSFEFMARFFENSLAELSVRNQDLEGVFRRVDANRFFATLYREGRDVARATVYMGNDGFGRGINYVQGETMQSNSMNESLTVEADDQTLYFRSMGMASFGRSHEQKLSQEGAAEAFWSILIDPLQRSSW